MREFSSKKKLNSGAAILLTVLLIGGIVAEIGIANVILLFYSGQSVFGVKFSAEALAWAEAGIEDGRMKVVRNKDYLSTGYTIPSSIDSTNLRYANVMVCKDLTTVTTACDTAGIAGKTEITSTGTTLFRKRRLRATLNVDALTGEVNVESIEEISMPAI